MSDVGPARGAGTGLFYGWVVVASAFTVMFIGFGIAYSFGAFFADLQRDFQATRGEISLIFAIGGFLYFSLGAASGTLADRVGPRWVVAAGMLLVGVGLLLGSRAQSLWQIYAAYGLSVGFGVGFAYVPAIGAVQPWFARRRGFASGIAVAGIGVGTLVMPPVAAWLIELEGWRGAYVTLAVLAIVAGIGAAVLIHGTPRERGLLPDGGRAPPEPAPAEANPTARGRGAGRAGASLGEALRSRPFWILYAAAAAAAFGIFIPFVHLAAYARDHGLSEETSVGLLSLLGLGSILGRFILGGAADRMGRRFSFGATFAGMGLMLLWWLVATSAWSLALFAIVFGAFYGGFVALAPALTTDYFGDRNVSGIIGLLYTSVAFGTLLGPTLAGVAYDLSDSYVLPIAGSAAANLIGVCCIALLAPPDGKYRGG